MTTVTTLMTWTPAHAQDQRAAGGVSNTSCVGGFTTFNCVTRWGPASDPYVRVVPRPVDEAEKARLVARDRKWLALQPDRRTRPLRRRTPSLRRARL
jgi:hypothetical protein